MKVIISEKNTINVYKFMEMCGLKCSIKKNINISHRIMMKKIALRKKKFPNAIKMPTQVNLCHVNKEDIYRGTIVIVSDDYNKKIAYLNPIRVFNKEDLIRHNLTEAEKEEKREELIEEFMNKEDMEYKPGYIKYLLKKYKKDDIKQQEEIKKLKEDESLIEEEYFTKRLENKRKVYANHSFRRR